MPKTTQPSGPVILLARICDDTELGTYPTRRAACKALALRGVSHLSRALYAVQYADGSEHYPDALVDWLQKCDRALAYDPGRVVWG